LCNNKALFALAIDECQLPHGLLLAPRQSSISLLSANSGNNKVPAALRG
jgi:hypothetical protein